jgi:3-isopropylmalate/(R)-2-methylmalate dehydratase small subunit
VLVVGDNFGCGSSREHAPWALLANGIRAVISTRFADIFRNNSLKNGLLTITVEPRIAERLLADSKKALEAGADAEPVWVAIDLEQQKLTLPWEEVSFEIDPFGKHCILTGVDQMGYLVDQVGEIEAFEKGHKHWVDTRQLVRSAT